MDQHLIALGKVFSNLTELGIPIFSPVLKTDIPYDFIIASPGQKLYRTLVRYRSAQRGKLEIALKDTVKNSVDILAIYCPDTEELYYLLSEEINKATVLRIDEPERLSPGLRLAKDYKSINRLFGGEIMFDIQVMGTVLRKHSKGGELWVEAPDNKPFKIVLENKSSVPKMYVVSVDGLNAIDGKPATEKGSGYIVPAFSTVVVDGWRKNYNEVSEFFFTKKENSYSELKGDGVDNCGVIGVAVFDEKPKPPTLYYDSMVTCDVYMPERRDTSKARKSLSRGMQAQSYSDDSYSLSKCSDVLETNVSHKMGTGWGDTKTSKVHETSFDAKDKPTYTMSVFYDSRENLIARGIIQANSRPNPFPASREFCQAP